MVLARRFSADGDFVERLEGLERRRLVPPDDIIGRMRLTERDSLLDLGAETGYFSVPASERAGMVIALDAEPKMLRILSERICSDKIGNIDPVRGDILSIPVVNSTVSRVLAAFVYHEASNPRKLMDECSRVLSPFALLTVVDFQKRETPIGPPVSERKTPDQVVRMASSRFDLESRFETEVYYQLGLRKL